MKILKAAICMAALGFTMGAHGQNYPTKPVRLINPWTPAGPAELLARQIGTKLQESLGQPFIIESKPGANGTIGATYVAKAPADGYTILFSHVGPMAIHPAVVDKMPYDTLKDFEPITQVAAGALVFLVRNDIPARNVRELIAYAKANPGKLSCGSVGPASTSHLACEQLNMLGGVTTVHVPYKGSAPVVTDMLGGTIAISFLNIAGVKPQIDAGQIRAIGVSTLKRSAVLPDLPAMSEVLPGFEVNSWYGMMAPAGTPKAIVDKLNGDMQKVVRMPEVAANLKAQTLDPLIMSPEQFAQRLKSDYDKYEKVIKVTGAKID